jgi:hypothetical protein
MLKFIAVQKETGRKEQVTSLHFDDKGFCGIFTLGVHHYDVDAFDLMFFNGEYNKRGEEIYKDFYTEFKI